MAQIRQKPVAQKPTKCVSNVVRRFADGQTCTLGMPWCNNDPATTVLCHSRMVGFNGTAQKPPDYMGYHGCSECHRRENEASPEDIFRATMRTIGRLYDAGIITVKGT